MILKRKVNKMLSGDINDIPKDERYDILYFGEDAMKPQKNCPNWVQEDMRKYLGKTCVDRETKEEGIIMGFENSLSFLDLYYIVYFPESERVKYELMADSEFVDSIIL